jgi:hypothetical protein
MLKKLAMFAAQKLSGQGKTTGKEVINVIKPGTTFTGTPKYQKEIIKAKTNVMKKFQPINEGIAKQTKELRKTLQGMRGERITQSGISKGKDVTPGIYEPKKKIEKKAKGGRVGLKAGTNPFKRKTNVDKIKKTFGPKSLGMQSVIYGLDKNKNVTAADPKAKFIAAAKKKKNKKVIG